MCGISGLAGIGDRAILDRMSQALVHRGPDGRGTFSSLEVGPDNPSVLLDVRRLAIVDLENGQQPMRRFHATVAFNGEIYNHAQLREELAQSCEFSTTSDTEVIVMGYLTWGLERLLEKLNGMFALAIFDESKRELFLARDRTGQKPLYYSRVGKALVFASEIKSILASNLVERELNHAAIDSFLTLRYVPQPDTLLKSVHVLPGGHWARWTDNDFSLQQYWQPGASPVQYLSIEEASEQFGSLLDASVRRTVSCDVPVSSYLSGGVDSGLMVATVKRLAPDNFSGKTFSAKFGTDIDEHLQARQLADELGFENETVGFQLSDMDRLKKVMWHLERPIAEPLTIMFDLLSEAVARNTKVVLSGEGADELFAGYSFHRVIRKAQRLLGESGSKAKSKVASQILNLTPVPVLNRLFSFPAYLGSTGKKRVVNFVGQFPHRSLRENYVQLRTMFDSDQRARLYSTEFADHATDQWMRDSGHDDRRPLERLLSLQYDDWLQDFALLRQDKIAMAHGLEVRLPYLDNDLIDFATGLPESMKITKKQNKYVLRHLADQRLPHDVAARPKQAFYFPLEKFVDAPIIRDLIEETTNEQTVRRRGLFSVEAVNALRAQADQGEFLPVKQIFGLVVLEIWMRIFIDNTEVI